MTIDGGLHAPPVVEFAWGEVLVHRRGHLAAQEDDAVLRGRPAYCARACTLSLKSYKSAEVQLRELKLSSPDRSHVRVLREGETLAHIAYEVYGDPRMWRPIALANGIERPRFIEPGTPLLDSRLVEAAMPLRIDRVDTEIEILRKEAGGRWPGAARASAAAAPKRSPTVRGRAELREKLRPIVMEILNDELTRIKRKVGAP